jgi:hypothetical protein
MVNAAASLVGQFGNDKKTWRVARAPMLQEIKVDFEKRGDRFRRQEWMFLQGGALRRRASRARNPLGRHVANHDTMGGHRF